METHMRLFSCVFRVLTTTAAVMTMLSGAASAQSYYPNRPVTVIVPQATGGANDTIARYVERMLGYQQKAD